MLQKQYLIDCMWGLDSDVVHFLVTFWIIDLLVSTLILNIWLKLSSKSLKLASTFQNNLDHPLEKKKAQLLHFLPIHLFQWFDFNWTAFFRTTSSTPHTPPLHQPIQANMSLDDSNDNVREQDRYLPIANISNIMKKALPANGKIAKDAKETVQECVSEFISFITGEASEKCQQEKRKTINGDDILYAMSMLGFDNYLEPLKLYLHKYREGEKATPTKRNGQLKKDGGMGMGGMSSVGMAGLPVGLVDSSLPPPPGMGIPPMFSHQYLPYLHASLANQAQYGDPEGPVEGKDDSY